MPSHAVARHEFTSQGTSSPFRVVQFAGTETISQPYRFTIDLISDDPEIELVDVIDQPATLTMYRGDDPAEINGIVTSFQQLHATGGQHAFRYAYRAVVEPRLSRLALSVQNRVFQHLTVEEIASKLLKDAGVDVEFRLSGSYEPREYTTQYKESDLNFLQRLFEFEGIRYSFVHEEGAETLVVSDDASDAASIVGEDTVPYSHVDGLRPADSLERVREFIVEQKLVTGKARIDDYNYREPGTKVTAEKELDAKGATGVTSDYGVHAKTPAEAERLAKVRAEEIESTRVTATGVGDCLRFRSGQRFTLEDHYRPSLNQAYLLTSVHHSGFQTYTADSRSEAGASETPPDYTNAFTCVPASVPYRPPRVTPEPKLPGVMTAKVESGGGDYAYIDDQGRYRVRMPFDLADAEAGGASKPIRLAQPYSGAGYGMHFPVHADAEMVFACVDGNIDRPLGLSTVPNPSQSSPVGSGNHTMNRIVTASDNRIEIEDEAGNERIKLSTPHLNSIVQLGAPNSPVDGIVTTTDGVVGVHGAKGIYLNAWDAVTNTNWVNTVGSVVVGGAAFITKMAIANRVGKFDAFSKLQAGMTGAAGISLAAAGAGAVGIGQGLPGITLAAPGHVRMISNNSLQGLALAGVSFLTAATMEMTAGLGVSLASGTGLNLFAANDDLKALSQKDVVIESSLNNVHLRSMEDITMLAKAGHVFVEAEAGQKNVEITAGRHIVIHAKKNINVDSDEDYTLTSKKTTTINSTDDIKLKSGSSEISMKPNGTILLKSGGTSIEISSSGITLKHGPNTKLDLTSNGVFGKGLNTNFEAMTSAKLKANGSVSLESSALAKVMASLIKHG